MIHTLTGASERLRDRLKRSCPALSYSGTDVTDRARAILSGSAWLAMLWLIVRACRQSITIDEADTYLSWVAPAYPTQWSVNSNNHVLNSILMRVFTWAFGVSHLTVRAPALLGAALYIVAAYRLCVL